MQKETAFRLLVFGAALYSSLEALCTAEACSRAVLNTSMAYVTCVRKVTREENNGSSFSHVQKTYVSISVTVQHRFLLFVNTAAHGVVEHGHRRIWSLTTMFQNFAYRER